MSNGWLHNTQHIVQTKGLAKYFVSHRLSALQTASGGQADPVTHTALLLWLLSLHGMKDTSIHGFTMLVLVEIYVASQ